MGNSLLCHYIDNCFKKGIILWGQKHFDWGGAKLRNGGAFAPPVPMLKKALSVGRKKLSVCQNNVAAFSCCCKVL